MSKQQINFENYSLKTLHTLLQDGKFAVPKLQRVFVWNGAKAAKLLDSVYRTLPIGALTVWDTPRSNRHLLRVSTAVLPPYNEVNKRVFFLLDGQQRLSVLYRIVEGGVVINGAHAEVDFSRLVFRVSEGESNSRFQYRKSIPNQWESVSDVLASNWAQRLARLTPGQLNRVRVCRERLLSYKVPIVRVEMDNIDDARELFLRINSSGTPLGAADRAFARAAKFDLRAMAENSWEKLPLAFQGLPNEVFLQTRALLDDVQDVGVEAMSKVVDMWDERIKNNPTSIKQFTQVWTKQQAAMGRALDLLVSEFCVLDDGLLPYQNMVSTLTIFFSAHPRRPGGKELAEIRRWFWGTSLGQRYSGGGYRQNILKDVKFFRELGLGKNVKFKLEEPIDQAEIRRTIYGKRSSISDAFFCLLIKQEPIYLDNGRPMQVSDYASQANRKHKHHIFPRNLLQKIGVGKMRLNTVLNLCFISAEENSKFGARAPIKYLERFRNSRHFSRSMDKHLVPHEDDAGLWRIGKNGYALFLSQREQLVCKAFEQAAGGKLFRRD
jgi:hypothetical protein